MTSVKIIIYVLDDEEYILDLIKQMFSDDTKYSVSTFTNPQDFFQAFTPDIDLVITDVRVKDGYDVFKGMEDILSINPSCYIIVMSAYLDKAIMRQFFKRGASDVIEKNHTLDWFEDLRSSVSLLEDKLTRRAKIKTLIN